MLDDWLMEAPLLTERLLLRPISPADKAAVLRYVGHELIAATTLNIPHPYPPEAFEQFLAATAEARAAGLAHLFVLIRRADDELVGQMGLHIEPRHRRAELGYWIGVPHWGQGYATEAARRLVDWGFGALGLNRIYATHFAENPASGRVMQKAGMRHEGVLRQHVFRFDRPRDLVCYGILREEWSAAREGEP